MRRRVPAIVRSDLEWWLKLLTRSNGIHFFDNEKRNTIHLFSDASHRGMGAFFCGFGENDWKTVANLVAKEQAFAARVQVSKNDVFDINIFELGAILLAFQRWGHSWKHKNVVVHTDSNTAKEGLSKLTLKGEAIAVLRRILLTAAELDISITPTWIAGSDNELADAISRF